MTRQSTAESTKPKRRKPAKTRPTAAAAAAAREPSPDDVFYEIRDIIDEKYVRGKLLYRVDWADDPTTGERYDPTWEPAENVTEAAVADWEREKRRRQSAALEGVHSSIESDSQPVLPPNWRAKRRREPSVSEVDDGSPKRARASFDSGYTSPDRDDDDDNDDADWASVKSIPEKKAQIVLELAVPPGFDPSEYQIVSLSQSQSAPSSQDPHLGVAAPQHSSHQPSGGLISQGTIPDSQDCFDSLHTQSTVPSAGYLAETAHSEPPPPAPPQATRVGNSQEAGRSRSEFEIPSRQPETQFRGSGASPSLLETHELTTGASLSRPSPGLQHLPGEEGFHSGEQEESSWPGGFLTQPDYELRGPESSQAREVTSNGHGLDLEDPQDLQQSGTFPSAATGSHQHFQAAQRVSPLDSNPWQILTQVSLPPSEEPIPETVRREPKRASCQDQDTGGAPRRETEERDPEPTGSLVPQQGALDPPTPVRDTPFLPPNLTYSEMDGSPEGAPRSAVEIMRQLQADVFGTSPDLIGSREPASESTSVSPSTVLPGLDIPQHPGGPTAQAGGPSGLESSKEHPVSAVEEINRSLGIGSNMPAEHAVVGAHAIEFENPPKTVAPADLTASADHIPGADDGLSAASQQILGGSAAESLLADPRVEEPQQSPENDLEERGEETRGRNFIVTLPMAANARSIYLDAISENKATMIAFGNVFANSCSSVPDETLVAKMDSIFERLQRICDLPAYDDSLPEMGKEEMMKHATNSNSKYSFVYEFLNGLWDMNVRVLILSQPGRVFDYLEAVVSAARFPYTVLGQENSTGQSTEGLSVILAVAGQDLSKIQGGVNVILAFDQAARSVELPTSLGYESMPTVVISLVVTYSLEHLDQHLLQIEPDLDGLERKNALNLATAAAKEYLRNPERGYPEPHEAAEMFANFVRCPDGGLAWEPHPLPGNIFDLWLSSQDAAPESQGEALRGDLPVGVSGRKRPSDNDGEGTPKRQKLVVAARPPPQNTKSARMSDLLKRTLASHPVGGQAAAQVVEVPLEQLEWMASKIAELEARLATQNGVEAKLRDHVTSLESQLRSHERTIQTIQPQYIEALRDRTTYEKEYKAAVAKANAAAERLEAQTSEIEQLKSRLAEAHAGNPDAARLARAEEERDEARASLAKVEKKLRIAENDLEYSRKAYQDASNAHSQLNQEHEALKAKIAEFERRASDNLLRIHQVHAQNEAAAVGRQLDELQATLENRERELDRAKEELRLLKSGRRETRQGSVPRSPRTTGLMSPRPGRAVGGGGTGAGGAGSRGTSPAPAVSSSDSSTPVPGMTFFSPTANGGRWGHLRD